MMVKKDSGQYEKNRKNKNYNNYKSGRKYMKYDRGKISSGSYDLNKWFFGGYEKGVISTLYGPAGSGKTNFCILAAVSQAKKGHKVIYIDTEGGFSSERVKQILGDDDKLDKVLENIILLKATSFEEQKKIFRNLEKRLKRNANLVIVDGMAMLYRLELGEARRINKEEVSNINKELVRQMKILAYLARNNDISVLATNQVYKNFLYNGDEDNNRKKSWEKEYCMVGGDIMKYWSKCIIELSIMGKNRKARLVKHRSQPEKELDFFIVKRGIKKKGFF